MKHYVVCVDSRPQATITPEKAEASFEESDPRDSIGSEFPYEVLLSRRKSRSNGVTWFPLMVFRVLRRSVSAERAFVDNHASERSWTRQPYSEKPRFQRRSP